nr:diphthine--ammonia ligase [Candidatus Woesearchaeota archaeon]
MDVAVLYSGGKDSNFAVEYCLKRNWKIKYLLSVKPTRTDCYLFHYATVENTKEQAEVLGLNHIYVKCDVADPRLEADIVRKVVEKNPVDAVVLGGVGLQVTQIESIQKALRNLKIEVFAAHAGEDHEELFRSMIDSGYKIMITQVAADGLINWLGKVVNKENFNQLVKDSEKYGFHVGFEGGSADSLVLDAPLFKEELQAINMKKNIESNYCGYVELELKKKSLVESYI